MKNVKRMLTLALSVLTLAALPLAGVAADDEPVIAPPKEPQYLAEAVEVTETGKDYLLVKTEDGQSVQLNTGDAWFVDNAAGTPVDAGSVKAGDHVFCYTSRATTMSLPPQRAAVCVLTNVGESTPATLLTVESSTAEKDCMVLDCGDVILRVPFEARVTPLMSRERLTATDLVKGTVLLAWYDVTTLSLPAQATTDRVVVLEKAEQSVPTEQTEKTVTVKTQTAGETVCLPLREAAEGLGFTVEWNAAERSVHLTDGTIQSTVSIGTDSYYYATAIPGAVGMSAPSELGCAPFIDAQGRTVVPAAFFELLGAQCQLGDGEAVLTYA